MNSSFAIFQWNKVFLMLNPTYNLTDFSASEVLDNHKSVLTSFGIDPNEDELDLPYIYWIPKMH